MAEPETEPEEEKMPVVEEKPAEKEEATDSEADGLTVAPIGKAPELPKGKEESKLSKLISFFKSVKWQRTWDKITHTLLYILLAAPLALLAYIVITFFL